MNSVVLIGRLTRDPETRQAANGTKISSFALAVDRYGEGADFIPCKTFGKGAEFAEKYLHKGVKIAVSGRLQMDSYETRDGARRNRLEVIVNNHEFVEPKRAETPEDDFIAEIPEETPFV